MLRCLRHRHRTRIALFAIAALLWSQFALAGHAGCLMGAVQAPSASVAAMDHHCEGGTPNPDQSLCLAHCSQGDVSPDSARIPPVPPMLAATAIPLLSMIVIEGGPEDDAIRIDASPPASWHRPTPHPAALLLI